MAYIGQFNTSDVPEREDFSPLPEGRYEAMVVQSSVGDNKKKTGQVLTLEIDIIGPTHAGRKLFERLNIVNENSTAETISRQALAELCAAVGKQQISDTSELHEKRFFADVKVTAPKPYIDKDGVEKPGFAGNKIAKYLPYGVQTAAVQEQVQQPASLTASVTQKPWKK